MNKTTPTDFDVEVQYAIRTIMGRLSAIVALSETAKPGLDHGYSSCLHMRTHVEWLVEDVARLQECADTLVEVCEDNGADWAEPCGQS